MWNRPERRQHGVEEGEGLSLGMRIRVRMGEEGHFEASIFCHAEAVTDRCDCVAAVGVTCHVLISALQADLQPVTPKRLHSSQPRHTPDATTVPNSCMI